MLQAPDALPRPVLGHGAPDPLARILFDLSEAGVRPTPLNVIARATDQGHDDDAIVAMLQKLEAAQPSAR